MKITVYCGCGKGFETDMEPAIGRVVQPVACPQCGANCTVPAVKALQKELVMRGSDPTAPSQPLPTPMPAVEGLSSETGLPNEPISLTPPVAGPLGITPSSAATGERPKIRMRGDESSSSAADGAAENCVQHAGEAIIEKCLVCQKPMCPECMKQYGYVCSIYCKHKAKESGMRVPVHAGSETAKRQQAHRAVENKVRLYITCGVAAVAAVIGLWVWWDFFATKPSLKYSMPIKGGGWVSYAKFITAEEVLVMKDDTLSLYNVPKKKELWSANLTSYHPPAPPQPNFSKLKQTTKDMPPPEEMDGDDFRDRMAERMSANMMGGDLLNFRMGAGFMGVREPVIVTPTLIWVSFDNRMVGFDRKTGRETTQTTIEGRIISSSASDKAAFAMKEDQGGKYHFTRVDLQTGAVDIEELTLSQPRVPASNDVGIRDRTFREYEDVHPTASLRKFRREFLPAGANIAHFESIIRKANMVGHDTVKRDAPKGYNEKELSATDTVSFAEDVLTEMSVLRGGGRAYEDESTYSVTLRRVLGDAPDWKAEVTGEPHFYPLKTVDALVTGKTLTIFDKQNKQLWKNQHTYPIAAGHGTPCLEINGTLYVSDPGVLTAYDPLTGNVRWRITSVGISKIQTDEKGMLYISTTSLSHDSIQYSQQANLSQDDKPVLLKVHPKDGKILWRIQHLGYDPVLAGRFLYTRGSGGSSVFAMAKVVGSVWNNNESSMAETFKLFCLNSKNGKNVWEYYRQGEPTTADYRDNSILLVTPTQLQILKFLSF